MESLKNKNRKFSVLVPVYQAEKYLEECIQSVLTQTYPNWELILVNDGSTDRSGEICDCYAEKYSNIRVIHKENVGTLHTRRVGISEAQGDYYVFLDADDLLKKNALEVIEETIEKTDCDCVVYGYERFCNDEILDRSQTETGEILTDKEKIYEKAYLHNGLWEYDMLCRKAVKASLFGNMDFSEYHHIVLGEDDLQSLEIWANCRKIVFINDVLYSYRMNPISVMHTINLRRCRDKVTVFWKIYDEIQKQRVFYDEKQKLFDKMWLKGSCSHLVTIGIAEGPFREKIEFLREIRQGKLMSVIRNLNKNSRRRCWFENKSYSFSF